MATLTLEEQNDLRGRVLRGEELSLDDARRVLETLRSGQAMIPPDKPKRAGKKTAAMSKEALDESLKAFNL